MASGSAVTKPSPGYSFDAPADLAYSGLKTLVYQKRAQTRREFEASRLRVTKKLFEWDPRLAVYL